VPKCENPDCREKLPGNRWDAGEYQCIWCGHNFCDDCMEDHEDECGAREGEPATAPADPDQARADEVTAELNRLLG
jgi:hypothetical protein